jgi:hypothetical protein
LRISEALKLTVADVARDGLLIRETKFRKTRGPEALSGASPAPFRS